ncbi:hypothetical protein E4P38_20230 [Blastococcus sp. CT_GayMR16]|nr:hypothetical protein E4P38_20230 [Blastococcus sp. CT_GayMR16]
MHGHGAREIVEEMLRRQQAGDTTFLDELVDVDMVNHAAGPQGRRGLAWILRTVDHDLGPVTLEQHHLIGDGDIVAQHLTLHGTHRESTMPLLADLPRRVRPTPSLSRPVGRGEAVGMAGAPLDQLDPIAVGVREPAGQEVR